MQEGIRAFDEGSDGTVAGGGSLHALSSVDPATSHCTSAEMTAFHTDSDEDASEVEVSGAIKWFDATRGFGFLVGDNGEGDVLVHFSVLRPFGRRSLPEGARAVCLAVHRERGLQARSLVSFDLSTATGPDLETAARRAATHVDPVPLIAVGGQAFLGEAQHALATGADVYAADARMLLCELEVRFA